MKYQKGIKLITYNKKLILNDEEVDAFLFFFGKTSEETRIKMGVPEKYSKILENIYDQLYDIIDK